MNTEDTMPEQEKKIKSDLAAKAASDLKMRVPVVQNEDVVMSYKKADRVDHQKANINKWRPGFFSLLGGSLFRPTDTFEHIKQEPPLAYGLLSFTLIMVFSVLFSLVIGLRFFVTLELPLELYRLLPLCFLAIVAVSYLILIVGAAILHLTAELLGGRGPAKGILMVCCYSVWPVLLLAVVGLLVILLELSVIISEIILAIGTLVVIIWSLVILWSGISSIYELSWFKAALVFIMPVVVLVLIVLLLLLTIVNMMTLLP